MHPTLGEVFLPWHPEIYPIYWLAYTGTTIRSTSSSMDTAPLFPTWYPHNHFPSLWPHSEPGHLTIPECTLGFLGWGLANGRHRLKKIDRGSRRVSVFLLHSHYTLGLGPENAVSYMAAHTPIPFSRSSGNDYLPCPL